MNRRSQAGGCLVILLWLAGCAEKKPAEKTPVPVTVSVAELYTGETNSPYSASIAACCGCSKSSQPATPAVPAQEKL